MKLLTPVTGIIHFFLSLMKEPKPLVNLIMFDIARSKYGLQRTCPPTNIFYRLIEVGGGFGLSYSVDLTTRIHSSYCALSAA